MILFPTLYYLLPGVMTLPKGDYLATDTKERKADKPQDS